MAGILKEKGDKKLTIKGMTLTIPSVYGRITKTDSADGKTMNCGIYWFESEAMYEQPKPLTIAIDEVIQGATVFNVDIEAGETQTMELAHIKYKELYDSMGYDFEIDYV